MADFLDGKIYTVGTAGLEGLIYDFTQPQEKDEPSLVNAAIALRVWKLNGPAKFTVEGISDKTRALPPMSPAPSLVLTINNGLKRITNQAKHQTGSIQFLPSQLIALLGSDRVAAFSYLWVITPVTNGPSARPLGFGYDGVFGLVKEGYTLPSAAKV